jgi:hypothetical protein
MSFTQVLIKIQLVDVHQNGIRFKFVNVDQQYNIIEAILYFIRAKPSFFE